MSYTSSDPENFYREPDSSSLASTSTTASTLSKTKKKPWSKFKSSIKSIGGKMSGKPKFSDPTESSEQKKVKKNKKFKNNSIGESKPSTSEESPRETSPSKGSKSIIKKLSVESISTPFVGLQPSTVSPNKSYAKALHKSGSTSESNLSASDIDTPKKYLSLDKNAKYSLDSQGSPDSGRLSQHMESSGSLGSRPPSQITEEGYGSGTQKEAVSDVSVDSDSTMSQRADRRSSTEAPFYNLVAKTEQFAKTVRVPTPEKEKDLDVSFAFIKSEAAKIPEISKPVVLSESKTPEIKKEKQEFRSKNNNESPETKKVFEADIKKTADSVDEPEGRRRGKTSQKSQVKAVESADLIKSEQTASKGVDSTAVKTTIDKTNVEDKLNSGSTGKDSAASKKAEESSTNQRRNEKPSTDATSPLKTEEKPQPDTSNTPNVDEKAVTGPKSDKQEEPIKGGAIPKKSNVIKSTDKAKEVSEKGDSSSTTPKEKSTPEPQSKVVKESDSGKVSTKKEDKSIASPSSAKESEYREKAKNEIFEPTPKASPAGLDTEGMSVEEKLEAFLSAEGWPGMVKDVPVKASGRGSQQPDKRECLYKILVIGELGTGKTSIIKRYVHQFFSQHYRATIGVDFALKVINWDPNTIIRLQLWDIAGQERFGNMTRVYYKEAVGAFIVFDVTRSATFDAVLKWKQDLDSKVQLADGSSIPCVLLANKCDQQKEGIVNTPAKMDEYCKENNFSAWFETSAKENINIDEAAKSLVSQILQNDKMSQNGRDSTRDGGKFPLDGQPEEQGRSCAC